VARSASISGSMASAMAQQRASGSKHEKTWRVLNKGAA